MTIDLTRLPAEIVLSSRAVTWRLETRDGKPTKVPYRVGWPEKKASSTDPETWGSFTAAVEECKRGAADGPGFVLGDGFAGVDLDDCIAEDGTIHPTAMAIVRELDSYPEISPSGRGIKVFVRGEKPSGRCSTAKTPWGGKFEMYSTDRFFTVTGRHLEGMPTSIQERTDVLARLHERMFGAPKAKAQANTPLTAYFELALDDHELLERACAARNGSRFQALLNGDTSGHDSPSEADLAFCNMLAFWFARDAGRMDRVFRSSGLMREKWDERRGEQTYGQLTIRRAIDDCTETFSPGRATQNSRPSENFTEGSKRGDTREIVCATGNVAGGPAEAAEGEKQAADSPRNGRPRPRIEVRRQLNAVTQEAVEAIEKRADLRVYVRGRMLVTMGRDGSARERWLRRPPGSPVIVPIEQARMLSILDEAAAWVKFIAREKVWAPTRPPEWVSAQILARLEWPFPYLDAVVETPTIRTDGSVLSTPGWDEATGLLYEPMPGMQWPPIAERPSTDDVCSAVATLCEPVEDFPFVAPSDLAAYVAAVLSLAARHTIDGPVPMFPIRAPTPGTGKGLLAQVIGLVGTGREPPAMAMVFGDELRKRITALAVSGTSLVLLDNATGSVGSDELASALTTTEWEDRILGLTQMVRVPLRTIWLATGNNLGFKRTLGRRVIPIDLDAGVETPEDRAGFQHSDLKAYVRRQRPHFVAAALTILRAFHLAGRPKHSGARMGSFEAWDDLVRSAVIWAGLDDPATTEEGRGRGRIRAQSDDDTETYGALLEELARVFGEGVPFSTATVVQRGRDDVELQAILDTAAAPTRGGGRATARSLGNTMRDLVGRPLGGLVLHRHKRTWSVHPATRRGDI